MASKGKTKMSKSKISQGPWHRIRPLQRDEIDSYTRAGMGTAETIWGIRNNLCKVMCYLPRMMQTEVEYANSFIFDPPTFRGTVQEAGFNDRFLKELVISRTSLANRSQYSITHHAFMGMALYNDAGRGEEGHRKFLHLHEHEKYPDVYEEHERVVLDYTVKVVKDAHLVTDQDFKKLRRALRTHNLKDARLKKLAGDELDRFVDAQIVELTWLIGHYCLLNRWFTALQVPDETSADEDNFLAAYEKVVPEDIRKRNEAILSANPVQKSGNKGSTTIVDTAHKNEKLMRQYVDAWLKGDVNKAESFYADDVQLHHFGRNPLAGDYVGKKALQGYLKKMLEVTDKAETLKIYGVLASNSQAVTIIRVRFERSGKKPLEGKRITVFELGPDNKIHDVWVRDEDQYAVDEFFS